MSNPLERLITFFGGQQATARALQCTQPSVWAWTQGKTNMSATLAIKAEMLTDGEIKASELCPALAQLQITQTVNECDAKSRSCTDWANPKNTKNC